MKNILIAEDDLNIAELERDFLKLNGYSADIETDGTAALAAALTGRYDVLIVDLMLPGTGGYDIIKAVREKFEIPILVVSARSEDIDKIRGLEFGADDYLTKTLQSRRTRRPRQIPRRALCPAQGRRQRERHRPEMARDQHRLPQGTGVGPRSLAYVHRIRPSRLSRLEPEHRVHEGAPLRGRLG